MITISIQDNSLVVNSISDQLPPRCEVYDVDPIPMACLAWTNLLDKKIIERP